MSQIASYISTSPEDTQLVGRSVAALLDFPCCVYVEGEMGAGKTTLCSAIVHSLGYQGAVTSPTYNLVQEYPVDRGIIYHMDFYRLDSPAELEYLAVEDMWSARSLFLIEWPANGEGYLQSATHSISIRKNNGKAPQERQIILLEHT